MGVEAALSEMQRECAMGGGSELSRRSQGTKQSASKAFLVLNDLSITSRAHCNMCKDRLQRAQERWRSTMKEEEDVQVVFGM